MVSPQAWFLDVGYRRRWWTLAVLSSSVGVAVVLVILVMVILNAGGGISGVEHLRHIIPQGPKLVEGARNMDLVATEFSFSPETLRVRIGEAVNIRVINHGHLLHDFSIPALGVHRAVGAGAEIVTGLRTDRPGEYEFYCSVRGHKEAGMSGRIIVTP